MNLLTDLLIVFGLIVFEIISSIDNAIINAQVLTTMSEKAKRWFLTWGLLIAVFAIRGLLPWLIIWGVNPSLGPVGALTATFSSNPQIQAAVERSAPILLIAGGTFLMFLFFHWLFMEAKNYGLKGERFFHAQAPWFYAVASVLLTLIVWFALRIDPFLAFGSVVGSTIFFITHGFRQNAEETEKKLFDTKRTDFSKLLYLQVIDATFSIDGVLGAFAFTLAVPLILLGNGIGALVVRQLTVTHIDRINQYLYLQNGAMYSIFFLGLIMTLEAFGANIPSWVSPIITFNSVGYFFYRSQQQLQKA